MNRIAPQSPIVDLSHGMPPLDVRNGALLLVDSLPYLAVDAVVLAIVDPSVGRDRDLALESIDGRLLVGPRQRAARAHGDGARRTGVGGRDHLARRRADADLAVVSRP
jgi:S-adenosyl-l-methionine hydroxide adenosyltransferase